MNNQMYYDSNCADVFIYNSNRKNAKCLKMVHILHLISKDVQISDDRILEYFISKVDDIVYCMKDAKEINFSCYESYGKETYYNTINGRNKHVYMFHISHQRQHYSSIEDVINYLYRVIMDIYPYCTLDIDTIYHSPSVKWIIQHYYN